MSTGVSQTQLIPLSELAPGQAGKIRNDCIEAMIGLATTALRLTRDRLVVRDIRAKDDLVVYSAAADADVEDWGAMTGSTANTYETLTTGTMGDNRWMGFFGVKAYVDQLCITAIKFNIGGGDRAIWQLQALNEYDGMVGFTPTAVIIPQNIIYTISRYVRVATSPSRLVLKGVVVEPRGKVVSP